MALKIDLKPGEAITIGDVIVTLEEKSGKTAKLAIQAPQAIRIERVAQATDASIAATHGITGKP